ncbi:PaaI family thioesterase [Achromobacter pulmonis]|uniref:PaaI family thioesterase n=1 Tax=Achromobacter pulmonis TaxID=1389932 RepID=UPI001F4549E2|nr:PaaI family thioesterase [Achromobacter pulmonis]MCF7768960.1 PaaI family thioesterase [Achromobacter pulmonis]
MSSIATLAVSRLVDRSPLNRWLGMHVISADDYGVLLGIKWREELISNPDVRSTHGGILATLIDAGADYAVALKVGAPVPTIDLHVDYHQMAGPGDLRVEGKVIHLGARIAVAHARVFDMSGELVASGRGLYRVPTRQGVEPKKNSIA